MRVYARNGFLILLYWLVIKLCCWFWKRGELYDKTPDFAWKLLFFFSKPDCFFGLLFRKKTGIACPERKVSLCASKRGKGRSGGYSPTGELSAAGRILSPQLTAERRRRTVGAQRLNLMTSSPFDREGNARNFSSLENQALFATAKRGANKLFSLTLPLLHTTTSVEK